MDLLILLLLGQAILHKIENTRSAEKTAALICNTIEGKPVNYDSQGNPLERFFGKLERSAKLCAALTGAACVLILLFVSNILLSMTDNALHLLHTIVTDTSTYNFLAIALIISITGICLAACSFGCIGGLFLVGHLQRWQNTQHARRMEAERTSKNH